MTKPAPKGDTTGTSRQRRRRETGKVWLEKNGFTSWESLHTKLMSGEYVIIKAGSKTEIDKNHKAG